MNPLLKKILAVLASAFILSVAYYGSYLPLQKSQQFIDALRSVNEVRSLADFEKMMSVPLDAPSPIGQEEVVRNIGNVVLNLLQQRNAADPRVVAEIIRYINSYYAPIIRQGHGMSFEQNLYILGAINEIAFAQTKDPQYLQAAGNYYLQGLKLGPKRPQFLYGMLDIYRTAGNMDGVRAVAQQILTQWPDDQRTRDAVAAYLANPQSPFSVASATPLTAPKSKKSSK